MNAIPMLATIDKEKLAQLCQQFHVARLYMFGSAASGTFINGQSDIDLIVRFEELTLPPEDRGQLYWDLLEALENLFERKVDLLIDKKFTNPYFQKEVEDSKVLIYDRSQSQEVLI